MSLAIAGMGWVTPLGLGLDEVWQRLLAGERAEPKALTNPESGRVHHYAAIAPKVLDHLGRQPRLRRASPISYYSVGAGLAALEHAGIAITPEFAARTAIIFAVSSGSVVYTRRFFEGVVKQGPGSASPLLFPETVYNAPASHLAAQLGIDGMSYTLVGDSSVPFAAVKLAEQLLLCGTVDYALVVGAEEIDWVLCEAYRDWRFADGAGQSLPYAQRPGGALLSEGAGALLLTRTSEQPLAGDTPLEDPAPSGLGTRASTSKLIEITASHDGASYTTRAGMTTATARVVHDLTGSGASPIDCIIGSANGSWSDTAEAHALTGSLTTAPLYCPKLALGEALGASGVWQIIAGALALQRGEFPLHAANAGELAPAGFTLRNTGAPLSSALVLSPGVNQQASGLVLRNVAKSGDTTLR